MIVMKFGGSSVESAAAIERVAGIVKARAYRKPVVVVSAMGKTTNKLLAIAAAAIEGNRQEYIRQLHGLRDYHSREARLIVPLENRAELDRTLDEHFQELTELVKGLASGTDQGVACTSSLMLDWAGKKIDFQAGSLNFHGFGFQPSYGLPVDRQNLQPRELLFACGGSMLVQRDVFLAVGGFDPDYFAFFEDVDFGWRLWLLGYRVTLTPSAITYHRHHGTTNVIPNPNDAPSRKKIPATPTRSNGLRPIS